MTIDSICRSGDRLQPAMPHKACSTGRVAGSSAAMRLRSLQHDLNDQQHQQGQQHQQQGPAHRGPAPE